MNPWFETYSYGHRSSRGKQYGTVDQENTIVIVALSLKPRTKGRQCFGINRGLRVEYISSEDCALQLSVLQVTSHT